MDIGRLKQLINVLTTSRVHGLNQERDRSNFRPTGAALRNPKDPVQAQRIEAAKCKRARKASLAQCNYNRCIAGGF